MFHLIQDTGKGRRVSRSGKAQRISSTTLIGMVLAFLFIGSFVRFGPGLRQARADEPKITIYKLTTASIEKGCIASDAMAIKINDKTINTNLNANEFEIEIIPGSQTISVAVPGKPNVKVSKVVVGSSEEDKRAYDANDDGVATVPTIDKKTFLGSINVFVYLSGICGEGDGAKETSREVKIFVRNKDCREGFDWAQNYEGWQVKFGDQTVNMDRGGEAMVKLTYQIDKNATYDVGVIVPNEPKAKLATIYYNDQRKEKKHERVPSRHDDPNRAQEELETQDYYSQDYQTLSSQKKDHDDGNVDGVVKALPYVWWDEPEPVIQAYMVLAIWDAQCQERGPDFFSLKILAVSGKVEVIAPSGSSTAVKVNSRIELNSTIRTGPGASIILESKYGNLITIAEDTEVQTNLIMGQSGQNVEAFIRMGKIQIKQVRPQPKSDAYVGVTVRTKGGRAEIPITARYKQIQIYNRYPPKQVVLLQSNDFETIFMVSHDEKTNVTTVGVEEGKVEVTPKNTSLKPFTLSANQQVQVSANSVSAVTYYSGESTRVTRMLRYVGIGAAILVGLVVVVGVITLLYRRVNRAPVQPASQQSGIKVKAAPVKSAAPAVATNEWRCPNPQCGKLVPANKKFCTACGTQSGFKVEATPAYVASHAVATREQRCPNPQCGKLVPASKKFCTACGASMI